MVIPAPVFEEPRALVGLAAPPARRAAGASYRPRADDRGPA